MQEQYEKRIQILKMDLEDLEKKCKELEEERDELLTSKMDKENIIVHKQIVNK